MYSLAFSILFIVFFLLTLALRFWLASRQIRHVAQHRNAVVAGGLGDHGLAIPGVADDRGPVVGHAGIARPLRAGQAGGDRAVEGGDVDVAMLLDFLAASTRGIVR